MPSFRQFRSNLNRRVLKPLLSYASARIGLAATSKFMREGEGETYTSPSGETRALPNTTDTLRRMSGRTARSLKEGFGRAADTDQAGEGIRKIELGAGMARLTKGSTVPYYHVHEDGFDGDVDVPEHSRTSKLGNRFVVQAHQRKLTIPARPSLAPALERETPRIIARAKKLLDAFLEKLIGGAAGGDSSDSD